MHVHNNDRNLVASPWGHGRHGDADAAFTLRRKALLEIASPAAADPSAVNPVGACGPAPGVAASAPTDASTYDLTAMRRQKGSVSILTQDGDTVKIRFRSTEGLAVQSATRETADGTTSTTSVYAFAAGRMRVEVNGELDADELKAIGDLMEKVDALATQFFDGDTQSAFSAAADLGFDSGEIAGFALRLSVKESVRATLQAPATSPAPLPAAADVPQPAPAQATPVADPVAPDAPVEPATAAPVVAEAAAPAEPVSAAPVQQPAGTTDPAASLQLKLGSFLSQVLDALSGAGGSGRAEFSMKWKLQVMISAVQSMPAAAAADPAGTKLATDSLQDLSSTQA